MFTGIVTHTGIVTARTRSSITVRAGKGFVHKLARGMSIALDGVCLTVTKKGRNSFSADLMGETERRTTLGRLRRVNSVNLELPATPASFLSGHVVQGHVDGLATLIRIERKKNGRMLKFSIPRTLSKYIVEKGSIAVNGIALTIIEVGSTYFVTGIIPHTWESTSLKYIKVGDRVNVEVDVIAKYVEKLV